MELEMRPKSPALLAERSSSPFLRLPIEIRHRIYRYAGLITNNFIMWEPGRQKSNNYKIPDEDYNFVFAMLQVCRQTHIEVKRTLFTQNIIILTEKGVDKGLVYLLNQPPSWIALLKDLVVHLRLTSYTTLPRYPRDVFERRIKLWRRAAAHIMKNTCPRTLKLSVICDTGITLDSQAVVRPLLKCPGVLLEFQLRLYPHFKQDTFEYAHSLRCQIEADPNADRFERFPFFKLPRELRQRILQYTDVATPFKQVEWSPGEGFRAAYPKCQCRSNFRDKKDIEGRSFNDCEAHSRITETFCLRFSSSGTARCRHGPSAEDLMAVSKAMYEEVVYLLYSSNRITLHPSETYEFYAEDKPMASYSNPGLLFLANHSLPQVIDYLRNLEIVFPPAFHEDKVERTEILYREWCRAIDILAIYANIPRLTLTLHLWSAWQDTKLHPAYHQSPTRELDELEFTVRHARTMLEPLKALRNLGRLFIHLQWPIHWAASKHVPDDTQRIPPGQPPGFCGHYRASCKPNVEAQEELLERYVMGDNYNSHALGKADQYPSAWLLATWDNNMPDAR